MGTINKKEIENELNNFFSVYALTNPSYLDSSFNKLKTLLKDDRIVNLFDIFQPEKYQKSKTLYKFYSDTIEELIFYNEQIPLTLLLAAVTNVLTYYRKMLTKTDLDVIAKDLSQLTMPPYLPNAYNTLKILIKCHPDCVQYFPLSIIKKYSFNPLFNALL